MYVVTLVILVSLRTQPNSSPSYALTAKPNLSFGTWIHTSMATKMKADTGGFRPVPPIILTVKVPL